MRNKDLKRKVSELIELIKDNMLLEMDSIKKDVVQLSIEKDSVQDLIELVKQIEEMLEYDEEI